MSDEELKSLDQELSRKQNKNLKQNDIQEQQKQWRQMEKTLDLLGNIAKTFPLNSKESEALERAAKAIIF